MSSNLFDKNNSLTYQVVHRSQQDSRYHDPDASPSVMVLLGNKNQNKAKKKRTETVEELKNLADSMKENEGKSSNFGIVFDDSEYDYLQHLKPIGQSDGVFIPKKEAKPNNKLKNVKLSELFGDEVDVGEELKYDYTKQQDIPDEIKGFKPDLNPDLREVLTALDDDNYLDQDQDIDEIDVFDQLLGGDSKKKELTLREYDEKFNDNDNYIDNEDWDYDDYEDGDIAGGEGEGVKSEATSNFNWEKDFAKYKRTKGQIIDDFDSDNEFSDNFDEDSEDDEEVEEGDVFGELPDIKSKNLKSSNTKSKKKNARRKKGATTDTSSYSMSSSALCRTEQMTIIDDKFDILKEKYIYGDEDDEEEEYEPFNLENERDDFMELVDDFLDNYQLEKRGKRIVKKNAEAESYKNAALSVTKSKKTGFGTKNLTDKMDGLSL